VVVQPLVTISEWRQHRAVIHMTELKSRVWLSRRYCCCHKGALSFLCQFLFSYM